MTGEKTLENFTQELSSSLPAPGGGGAAAVAGALSASLAAMAAELTLGKKKYEEHFAFMERAVEHCGELRQRLLELADKDEEGFLPLARVYSLPKDTEGYEALRRNAVLTAAVAPMDMLKACAEAGELIGELTGKVSRLMVSDAGCAAALCISAAECAAMNVFVNTRLLAGDSEAERLKGEASAMLERCRCCCGRAVEEVFDYLNKE